MSTGDLTTLDKFFIWWTWPFSIQLSETVHASALYAVDLEVFKEDPMGCCKVTSTFMVTLHHCFLIDDE